MLVPAQAPHKRTLPEQMLIMRLITSIGLALLLAIGLVAMNHLETAEPSATAHISAAAFVSSHADASGSSAHSSLTMDAAPETDFLVGATLCLLGVLCGLVFFALTRSLRQRYSHRLMTVRPRIPLPLFMADIPPRSTALSLSQMGLSRT